MLDRTIPASCQVNDGHQGFCNLYVSKTNDEITLDPHVTASSVISLNEDGALAMSDTLTELLDT
jgi:hypothetical protein